MAAPNSFSPIEGRNVLAGSHFHNATITFGDPIDYPQRAQAYRALHFPRNDNFVQRTAISAQIERLLPPQTDYQSAALWGLGGSGKTQLALEYAYGRCGSDASCSVFWVHADTEKSFAQDYKYIATKLGLAGDLDSDKLLIAVRTAIEGLQQWVMVLDNADLSLFGVRRNPRSGRDSAIYDAGEGISDGATDLSAYIPRGTTGTVLWTSRDQRIVGSLVGPGRGINVVRITDAEVCEDRGNDDSEDEDLWDRMSTTSTLVQDSIHEAESSSLIQAIKFLRDDMELFSLFQRVIERPGVGIDRFRRILVNILRYLAVELGLEANDKDQKSSAQFVRRYRLLIASAITESVAAKALKPIELEQDAQKGRPEAVAAVEKTVEEAEDPVGEESADDDDEDQAEGTVDVDVPFDSITTFIRSSKAYAQMARRLANIAYPSFRSRATEWVEKWLRRKCSESDDISDWEAMRSRMFLIISELHYSQPKNLLVDKKGETSRFERFQLRIESLAGEEWNWWPFLRPRPKIGQGESRLGWTCSCQDPRWEAVPNDFAEYLGSLVKKFPLAGSSPLPVSPPPTWHPGQATGSTAKGSPSGAIPNLPAHGQIGRAGSLYTPLSGRTMSNRQAGTTPQARYIFLFSHFGKYTLDELPSLHLDTAEFGLELRLAYLRRKGFWSSLLSVYGFSHCEFVKFEKYRRNSYANRGYGLPDLHFQQYYYSPTDSEPPITPEEFKDLFRCVARQQMLRWVSVLPLYIIPSDDFAEDTVDRIPQRFWNYDKRSKEREDLWGIYIHERRSSFMTSLYIVLSLAPFISFCFLYSFGVVTGDIQNATTPLALSLTVLGLFLGSLIKR